MPGSSLHPSHRHRDSRAPARSRHHIAQRARAREPHTRVTPANAAHCVTVVFLARIESDIVKRHVVHF